jgi:peptide/nickel transport system substrate-binding protein
MLAAAAALLVGVAACGSDDGDTTATATAAVDGSAATTDGQPIEGGALTYLHPFATTGFDPAIANVNTQFSLQNFSIYDALAIVHTADGTTQLRLLESADSTDGLTWVLKVRPEVTFSDGTPFDAEAIKFNWERLADPATAAVGAAAAQTIASMRVVDPLTLEVTLVGPNGQFPTTIATNSLTWIGSPAAIRSDPSGFNAAPVGAGAFTVQEWVPNTQTVLVKNPTYSGPVHLDKVIVKDIADEAQRFSTFRSGGGDLMQTINGLTAAAAQEAGAAAVTSSPNGGYVVFFNVSRPPFDDVRARRAVSAAMDGAALSAAVYGGSRDAAANAFQQASPFYGAGLDQPEPSDADAQALFDELADDAGRPLEVVISYAPAFAAEAEWFQTKLAAFDNVDVSLDQVDTTDFQARFGGGDVAVGIHSYNIADPDGLTLFTGTGAPNNYSQYASAEMDRLLQEGRSAMDLPRRQAIYTQVQQLLLDDVPYMFFLRRQAWALYDPDVVHGASLDGLQSTNGELMLNELWVTR